MPEATEQRKLAAIMFTDMVGYTALTQRNEKLALELLEEHRRLLRELFPKFNGHEIETTGDGFLVEFASALEAARCAIEIQRTLATRSISVPPDHQIQLRIGIHVGDVVHKDGHVLGDGVNIAARLQPLAEPGGICISVDVARQVQRNLEARVEPLGAKELKNVEVPVEICRIVLPWEKHGAVGQANHPARARGNRTGVLAVAAIAISILIGASWFLFYKPVSLPSSRPGTNATTSGPAARSGAITSLAVLPFLNVSGDPDQEYFVDGITELLCSELAGVSALKKVISRTTIMQYKETRKKTPEIAAELGVDAVVEGSAQREGNLVVVSVQLIEGATDRHLWATNYAREVSSLLKLKMDLARAIAAEIKAKLTPQERSRLASGRTVDAAALEAYLKGRFFWNKRTPKDLNTALEYFNQAIEKDPNYALAYAGLAACYNILPEYAKLSPKEAMPKAKVAATKALEIDGTLAEAHASLALVKAQFDWDWGDAENEYKRAIELNPNYATAHHWYGLYLVETGRLDEAMAEIKRAQELDPLSLVINVTMGTVFHFMGKYDQAIQSLRKTLELDPNFPVGRIILGAAYEQKGMLEEAIAEFKKVRTLVGASPYGLSDLGRAYAVSGRRNDALQVLNELNELVKQGYSLQFDLALVYDGLGEKEKTFECLEKAYEEREVGLVYLEVNPAWKNLRSDPRFISLLKKIGLEKP